MSSPVFEALHADPWTEDFVDLTTLNARAADAIEECVQSVRAVARSAPRTLRSASIVVLGPPGAGKTHLFSRLRRHLGPRAVFVHIRPLVHAPMTPRFVLGEVVRQLGYATHDLLQLNALVGSLFAHLSGAATSFPSTFLSEYQQLAEVDREASLDEAVDRVLALFPEVDDGYLRRLLQAPFATGATQRALLAWLSGRDCDVAQLSRIGATASLSEELAMPALRTLCSVASLGAPIVLVMDQLENLIEGAAPGPRLIGYANLAAELVDAMRGLVLVHMALDTEWNRGIEPALNLSQRSRLLMRTETLALPTPREREDLLRLWIERLPDKPAPYPWPFTEKRLSRVLAAAGMTPRMLLVECQQAVAGEGSEEGEAEDAPLESGIGTAHGLAAEWERRVVAARQVLAEADQQRTSVDASRVADGLLAIAKFVEGARVSAGAAQGAAQLLVENSATTAHVGLLHQGHHRSLAAALSRLTELAARDAVIAVRERSRDFPPTWKDTLVKRDTLLATGRARWIWLEPDDVVRLLALDALLQGARSGDVTNGRGEPVDVATVTDWVRSTLGVPDWGISKALFETGEQGDIDEEQSGEPADAPSAPEITNGSPDHSVAMAVLRQLRIASLERVVREASRIDPRATRAAVLAELEANEGVRFFGRSIVCVRSVG